MPQEGELVAGRYRLEGVVGEGAMGVVWRAHDERLVRTVAVKQISRLSGAEDRERERGVARVMREGRLAARLQHPNAVVVYDVAEHDDLPWLVMEYVAARNLSAVLATDGVLDDETASRVGRQAADALTAAHAVGIVHRDIKPANLLITADGVVKVTDFGVSRAVDEASLSSTGTLAGTPAYLAPEVARGQKADFPSDVYSLGATLYAAREGHSPAGLASDNALAVIHRVASGEILPPSVPGPLTELLRRVLDADPTRRPQMEQFRDELARTISENAVTTGDRPTPAVAVAAPAPASMPAREPAPEAASSAPRTPVATPPGGVPVPVGPPPGAPTPPHAQAHAHATIPQTHPAPPPSTATDTAPSTRPVERRPRRRALLVAGGVGVLLVLGIVVAVLAATPLGGGGGATSPAAGDAAPGTSTPSGGGTGDAVGDVSGSGSTGGSSSGGAVPGGSAEPDPSPQAGPQQAVASYYALMPQRLDEGWGRLTASYQQNTAGGFDGYARFWAEVSEVGASEITAAPGDAVDATVTYVYRDGRTVRDRTRFGLLQQDGLWKIASSTSVGG